MQDIDSNGEGVLAVERRELLDERAATPAAGPGVWRGRLQRFAIFMVAMDVVLASLLSGLRLRQRTWIHTDAPHPSLRFDFDIENAYRWGTDVMRRASAYAAADREGAKPTDWRDFWPAYVGLYDYVVAHHPDGEYQLDYTPTRLLIAALWVRHEHVVYPHVSTWQRPYDYTAPLLRLNAVCELLAAIGAFLLVRHWVWRGTLPSRSFIRRHGTLAVLSDVSPAPRRAWVLGLVAAMLVWFNPAILFDAHVFPQWDVWLLPSFFLAAWLGSTGRWFIAGLLIPFGILMKGQLTMVTPFFIIWPLLEGDPMGALRFVAGFALAGAGLLSPWLVNGHQQWLALGLLAWFAVAVFVSLTFDAPRVSGTTLLLLRLVGGAVVLMSLFWLAGHWAFCQITGRAFSIRAAEAAAILGLMLSQLALYRPRQRIRRSTAMAGVSIVLALAVVGAAFFYHGSMSWKKVSFDYPTRHWRQLSIGEADNLGMILADPPFLWGLEEPMFTLHVPLTHKPWVVTIKALLIAIYTVTLVLCAAGAAAKSRRNDPAFLIALTAPWVLLFALLPQMHERYLLWAAAVSAITVAISFGWGLMHLVITALSTSMIVRLLLEFGQNRLQAPKLSRWLVSMHPGAAWAVLLCAGIFLYFAIAPQPRRGAASNPLG